MSECTITPETVRGFAQLIAGIDTDLFENGTPEPWRSVGQGLRSLPIRERQARLRSEVERIGGIDWSDLSVDLARIDVAGREPVATTDRALAVLPPAVSFPVDALPRVLRDYVHECAESLCCPPEFIGVPILTCAGAAIGTSVRLQLKPDWHVWPLLYSAVVGPSGTRKTPAYSLATRFTLGKELEYAGEHASAMRRYEQEAVQHQYLVEQRRHAKNKSELPPLPEKPKRPVLHRAWLCDSTMEAIGQRLRENPRGMVLLRDELSGFVLSMNLYRSGRGADTQNFLTLWSGEPVTIDRKNEPDPIVLPQPFLAVTGGIQPGVLPKAFGGDRLYDGFTARFLFAHPEVLPHRITDASLSEHALIPMRGAFETLFRIIPQNPYAPVPEPQLVRLSQEAAIAFTDWRRQTGQMTDLLAEEDPFRAVYSKMAGQLARIALILHCVGWATKESEGFEELGVGTMQSAIALADYFTAHARRVWAQLTETREDSQIRRVVSWMRVQRRPVTRREIQRAGVAGLKNAVQVEGLMRYLVDCGLVAPQEVGKAQRYHLARANDQ